MSTVKVIVLFFIGLFLAFLVFPVAFWVSAVFGYVMGVVALAIGVLLAVKRGGRTLPLVLGIVLAILVAAAIGATAFIHIVAYGVGKAVEEVAKTKYAAGVLGQPITVGSWEITILNVKESKYLRREETYFAAKEEQKAVIVTVRIRNVGKEASSVSDVWSLILVTNVNKSYEDVTIYRFNLLWDVGGEVKAEAVKVRELNRFQSLAPGTYIEGDVLFDIPQNETPIKLFFKVGVIGPTQVEVTLSK
jgi:hypothetical protein